MKNKTFNTETFVQGLKAFFTKLFNPVWQRSFRFRGTTHIITYIGLSEHSRLVCLFIGKDLVDDSKKRQKAEALLDRNIIFGLNQ